MAGQLAVIDYQRVVLSSLVLDGEAFILHQEGGRFCPMPVPDEIVDDDDTNLPKEYVWLESLPKSENQRVPAERVTHLFIRWYPGQTRGIAPYLLLGQLEKDIKLYQAATTDRELKAAAVNVFIKRKGGQRAMGANDTRVPAPKSVDVKLHEDGLHELGPDDVIETVTAPAPPTPVRDMGQYMLSLAALPFGISRLALTSDVSDVNYSSARFAAIMDHRVWERYAELVVRATRLVYDEWEERPGLEAVDGAAPVQWAYPAMAAIDPTKQSAAYKMLLETRILSRAAVRAELGYNSAQMDRQIREEQAADRANAPAPPNDREVE